MKTVLRRLTAAALAGAALTAFAPGELITAAAALRHAAAQDEQTLRVRIIYPASTAGEIWVGLYNGEAAFDDGDEFHSRTIPANAEDLVAVFENLPAGEYGLVAFHDSNADGDFTRNFLGIPAERYGFSNNPRPRFRSATWQEARFELTEDGPQEMTIELLSVGG